MKCGLLPLCHEAMTVGEIAYSEYSGGGPADNANIQQALSSGAQVRCICVLTSLLFSIFTAHINVCVLH